MATAESFTPTQRLERCLDRIRRFEPTVRAWVVVDERGARAQAERLTHAGHGENAGPLWGMPIGIKDLVAVAGLPTRAGSPLTSERPATTDAAVVARLRAAGAVILGKTVTTQWACFDPPPTANPWNAGCTPGGSSSGSAAAVALGMCEAAIGSQTGGSITRPASFCGVAGLKPTYGRVSVEGVLPLAPSLDHVGPLAQNVAGLTRVFAAIANQGRAVERRLGSAPRLGVVEDFFMSSASPGVRESIRGVLGVLSVAGAQLDVVPLPAGFDQVHAMHYRIMAAEAAKVHAEAFARHPEAFLPKISQLIRDGLGVSARDLATARAHHAQFRADADRMLAGFDALVTPATVTPAPDRSTTGDPKFNSPWSYAGLPTVSVPCDLAEVGLPLAIQFIGARAADESLLDTAAWCEHVVHFNCPGPWE